MNSDQVLAFLARYGLLSAQDLLLLATVTRGSLAALDE